MKPNNGMTDIGIRQKLNDRFGSLAAPRNPTSSMAAFPESGRSITPENVEIKVR